MYEAVTRGIRIRAHAAVPGGGIRARRGRYLWAYTIDIFNEGSD